MTSPFLYPLYGLGELPQAFARLAAVHGGTYMLNRGLEGAPMFGEGDLTVEYGPDGKCSGVKAGEHIARTKLVLGDPSYFGGKTKKVGQAVRAIALLDALPAGLDGGGESGQVISRAGRSAAPTTSTSSTSARRTRWRPRQVPRLPLDDRRAPRPPRRLAAADRRARARRRPPALKAPLKIFYDAYDLEAPAADGVADQVFISESYDPTSHFETAISDVMAIWKRITGKDLVLTDGPPQ